MTNVIVLVGDLGAGKSTLAAALSIMIRDDFPDAAQVTNVAIDTAVKLEDTNKFIAMKLISGDKSYALVVTDEAAQAGFESRGSGSAKAALESRVVTLARKAHVDLILVTQLLSMLDKRAQWLGNILILCEAIWESDNLTPWPDYFQYTIYDSKLTEIGDFYITWNEAETFIFPHMDTDDIPIKRQLFRQFVQYFGISEDDMQEFAEIMGIPYVPLEKPAAQEQFDCYRVPVGEEVMLPSGNMGTIVQRYFDVDKRTYHYVANVIDSQEEEEQEICGPCQMKQHNLCETTGKSMPCCCGNDKSI